MATVILILGLLFVSIGDRFLPQPFSGYSQNARSQLNQIWIGLFPKKRPKRPSERRERAVEEFEKEAQPSR